jgi:hypothetical protein
MICCLFSSIFIFAEDENPCVLQGNCPTEESTSPSGASNEEIKKEQDKSVKVTNTCMLGIGCKMDVYGMLGIRS